MLNIQQTLLNAVNGSAPAVYHFCTAPLEKTSAAVHFCVFPQFLGYVYALRVAIITTYGMSINVGTLCERGLVQNSVTSVLSRQIKKEIPQTSALSRDATFSHRGHQKQQWFTIPGSLQ
jgi:hypothetical protein